MIVAPRRSAAAALIALATASSAVAQPLPAPPVLAPPAGTSAPLPTPAAAPPGPAASPPTAAVPAAPVPIGTAPPAELAGAHPTPLTRIKKLGEDLLLLQMTLQVAQAQEKIANAAAQTADANERARDVQTRGRTLPAAVSALPAPANAAGQAGAPPTSRNYSVALIRRRGSILEAVLTTPSDGDLIIHTGDHLPTGASVVSITPFGVTVNTHGRKHALPLADDASESVTSSALVLPPALAAENFTPPAAPTAEAPAAVARPAPAAPRY